MMVPMADMLNHVSKHNANLEYTPVCGAHASLSIVYYARCLEISQLTFSRLCTGVFEDGVSTAH